MLNYAYEKAAKEIIHYIAKDMKNTLVKEVNESE